MDTFIFDLPSCGPVPPSPVTLEDVAAGHAILVNEPDGFVLWGDLNGPFSRKPYVGPARGFHRGETWTEAFENSC